MDIQTATAKVRIDLSREPAFALGAVEVNPATREVALGVQREILEPRVMQVLVALAVRRGEIVTRDDLIDQCWDGRAVGDDAINRCTGRLRRLADAFGGFELETIARVGYRLNVLGEAAAPAQPRRKGSRKSIWLALAAALVIAAGAAVWLLATPVKELVVRAPLRRVVAVLPFTPLSSDRETQLFGDQVATTIAETLSGSGGPIVPPSLSFQYRGAAKAKAARELRAMYVIDGEVVRRDGRVRVSVRLDDAAHGLTVFARTFDSPADRAADMPDCVAAYIASVTWGSDITHWSDKNAPAMLRIFELQKRGDVFAAYQAARELAAANPDDAVVQRIFAWDAINLVFASRGARKLQYVNEARDAAGRAIRLRPDMGDSYPVLAAATPHFSWAEREAHIRKGLAITPGSYLGEFLTWILNDAGRFRDAEVSARSTYERFAFNINSHDRRIGGLLGSGDATGALALLPQARRLWPDSQVFRDLTLEAAAFQSGDRQGRQALAAVLAELPPARAERWRGIVAALDSRRPADIAAVARDCVRPGDDWWSCMVALSMLGRQDDAFRIAGEAYPDQRPAPGESLVHKWLANPELPSTRYLFIPATAAMRADPRFAAVVERVGLLQYWRTRPPDFCSTERAPVCKRLSP
ncbi:winged helix-turn-helix domain-containing protein [Rhizomicrobium electricum]|uniref:OmpR/PhoB-type domain-containing protein n=1 Tax=Rhizomicrobium electricum TaxID=480070 RepID=A0ABN1FA00_9PROT|nr:winged helix-turn-helix domain-containing protein [Rhizomicrobium electricum]NIJ50608.1 TolB-like protein/DNA-binding winged helix-turn-helix (wHTH) protein/tetratricopeptide (TPR) repeat protein [Rhizomicrobium electricum]